MIPLIKKTLGEELEVLKLSTPTSGRYLHDKVIFLAFKKGEGTPTYCIKTVRHYEAKGAIVQGYENLKKLNALVAGNAHEQLFAKAIDLYDDGEHIFSVEEAMPGERRRLSRADLLQVVRAYQGFEALAKGPARALDEFARDLLTPELQVYFDTLAPSALRLVPTAQLGDLTEDNMLFARDGVHVVDYDRFGAIDLPGFDIFGLLYRFSHTQVRALCKEFLPNCDERLLFLYYALEHTVRKPHQTVLPQEIIAGYKELL